MQHSSEKQGPKTTTSGKGRAPGNKGRTYPVELLTRDEVRRLIGACSRRAPTGRRNAALLAVLYRSGVRISEALALHVKDIDFAAQTIRILRGKGGRARTVALDAGGLSLVEAWLAIRYDRGISKKALLFCTLQGKATSSTYCRAMLKRMATRAGIEKRVHPHGLRHLFACELLTEGVDLATIRTLLGHANIATTSAYLAGLRPERAIDAIRARPVWTSDDESSLETSR